MEDKKQIPFLSSEEEQELRMLHRTMKDKRKAYRINAIILLNRGYTKSEVERLLLIDRKSIIKYEKDYRKGGIEKLLRDDYVLYSGKLSEHEKEALKNELCSTVFTTAKAVCDYVKKKYGKQYTNDGMVKLLHALGFSYKKTKVVPAKTDREKQEQFIAEYRGLRAHIGENEYLYSIHDNARYNHSKRLREYLKMSHIKMIPLPSYSPNLNLIERLWGLMKRCVLYNHYYESYDDFCMAIMNFFTKWLPKHKDILYSLMAENFHVYDTA